MTPLLYIFGLPLLGALLVWLVPRNYRLVIRLIALGSALGSLAAALLLFYRFDASQAGYQFVTRVPWVESLGMAFHFGVDGINLALLLMGALVTFAAVAVSRHIKEREKEYYLLLLLMSGGILGAFASLDLFLLYFFHELALVPTFIMIGIWGRGERRNYATFQITLYLSLGALIALAGLVLLYLHSGARSFDLVAIMAQLQRQPLSAEVQHLIFPLLLFGFGILVSLWPFHSWAPLGYGSAPPAVAMMHAGVIKKFGLYGLIRVALPVMPQAAWAWVDVLSVLCLGNILFCGWVALRQKDLNLLIGNSSVAHMGFCFLGLASLSVAGITGCVMVMVAHGLLAALTFGLSGYLQQQTQTLELKELGGLWQRMPYLGAALMMAMFAGCGLPGFANFPGELLVMFGAWQMLPMTVVLAAWGALVIAAIYMLRAVREVLHGPVAARWQQVQDVPGWWPKLPYTLLLGALLVFGFYPPLLTRTIEPAVTALVRQAGYDLPAPAKVKARGGAEKPAVSAPGLRR
ncbi:MAG: NADH-quinone oxidoreductase subunit M [Verrucomicrobiae bacterium]|nr:NADH-quinone oxidoreductase subunit M [Verrucomicrobiae bacterium]